jgi:succinate dehydrogenase / fumarate reductase, iron-sulfur subunit
MQVNFQIIRQTENAPPWVQTYNLEVDPGKTILDCLNQIKWEYDGSLAFRKNCRNTICGSCAMRINGRSSLACKENVAGEIARTQKLQSSEIPKITIAPLGNLPVVKDLVVDMGNFWQGLEAVSPYINSAGLPLQETEFTQLPQEREKLNLPGNCILCGACYSECNAVEVNPEFVGPHALAKANRLVTDSRDNQTSERLERYNNETTGVWGCTRCQYCDTVCPTGVEPLSQIGKIKQKILAAHKYTEEPVSTAIRHRQVLVELVKSGGWIDERQFGIKVVGNSLRDFKGLATLGPLGLRMLSRGKFPWSFHPSEGTAVVRSLIESIEKSPQYLID